MGRIKVKTSSYCAFYKPAIVTRQRNWCCVDFQIVFYRLCRIQDFCVQWCDFTRGASLLLGCRSFGVALWELVSIGALPYQELTDEQVLRQVFVEHSAKLFRPELPVSNLDRMSVPGYFRLWFLHWDERLVARLQYSVIEQHKLKKGVPFFLKEKILHFAS